MRITGRSFSSCASTRPLETAICNSRSPVPGDLIAFWAALGMARFPLIRSEGHSAEDRVLFLASRRIEIGFGERPNDGAASH